MVHGRGFAADDYDEVDEQLNLKSLVESGTRLSIQELETLDQLRPTIRGQQRSLTNSLHFIAHQITCKSISTQDRYRRRENGSEKGFIACLMES